MIFRLAWSREKYFFKKVRFLQIFIVLTQFLPVFHPEKLYTIEKAKCCLYIRVKDFTGMYRQHLDFSMVYSFSGWNTGRNCVSTMKIFKNLTFLKKYFSRDHARRNIIQIFTPFFYKPYSIFRILPHLFLMKF